MNHFKGTKVLLTALTGCTLAFSLVCCANAQQAPVNLALGKTVTFNARPNYALCTDPGDSTQLTDGIYSSDGKQEKVDGSWSLWVQKATVGWQFVKPVIITIDLGSVQPISGVSFSTGGGAGGVTWPTAIYMAVSNDNQNWRAAGDLIPLSRVNGEPPAAGYAAFRYVTHDLHTTGRYISFGVVSVPFVFSDEIEVFKGDDAWLNQPAQGKPIAGMKEYVADSFITSAAQRRLYTDISGIRREIEAARLPDTQKNTFEARLDHDAAEAAQMPQLPQDFKTILPLDNTHRDILAIHGELLATEGVPPLSVWKLHRYTGLPLLATPPAANAAALGFSMLRNQFRSDDLLLTNAGGQPKNVTLQLKNGPQNAQDGWLQVSSVAWTDTSDGTPVADALLPVKEQEGDYTVDVPAGMTRRVWLTVDSSKVPAGVYQSTLEVTSGRQHFSVPFGLDVSKVTMNKPRLSLTMWDYSNGNGLYGINPQNRPAAIALMRSHYVNSPWASASALPRPEASAFDAQGNLKTALDFSNLDQWIALWPGVQRYMVFANVPDTFAGVKMDTPEFQARVGSWAKAISLHLKKLGLNPGQLNILLVDEPYHIEQNATIAAWAKAIKAAAPELTLFLDPRWKRPDQAPIQEAITLMDTLCPALPTYNNGGKVVQDYFQNLHAQGKGLWFYQTNGPSKSLDPQLYYRYQAWHAFAAGATGSGFWSFGDTGRAPSSWAGYSNSGISYAPAFLGKETVNDSIRWDAVREGVEDYEELAMLKDAIGQSHDAAWKARAQQVLDGAVKAVTGIWAPGDYTKNNDDPTLADGQLQNVREMLNQAA